MLDDVVIKICPVCGTEFESNNEKQIYCSLLCKSKAYYHANKDKKKRANKSSKPLLKYPVDDFTRSLTLKQQLHIVQALEIDIDDFLVNPSYYVGVYYEQKGGKNGEN